MFNPKKEFQRRASSYIESNSIQKLVAKKLTKHINIDDKVALDLGCGSGEIYSLIGKQAKIFISADTSNAMCKLHPIANNLKIFNCDFDDINIFDKFNIKKFDVVLSSSALQWSSNLDSLFCKISKNSNQIHFAIFTSNTFKKIQEFTKLPSPIYSKEHILECAKKYFIINHTTKHYTKIFDNNIEIFKYIKKNGISGGKKRLSYIESKKLIKNFPYNYLDYEVLFISGVSKV